MIGRVFLILFLGMIAGKNSRGGHGIFTGRKAKSNST
jgi:hypothetical protein